MDEIEEQLLVARRVPFIRIDGGVEGKKRQGLVDAFQTDPKASGC
jgi:SNF2 family DNA or RNA helicase